MAKSNLAAGTAAVAIGAMASDATAQMPDCVTKGGITTCAYGQSYLDTGGFSRSLSGDGSVIQHLDGGTAGTVTPPDARLRKSPDLFVAAAHRAGLSAELCHAPFAVYLHLRLGKRISDKILI
jgi:hypothetical protein